MEINRESAQEDSNPVTKDDLVQVYESTAKIRFKGPLEARFQRDYGAKNLLYFRIVLFAATFLYIVSGVVDWMLLQDQVGLAWSIRYVVVAPVLVTVSLYSLTQGFMRFQQGVIVFAVVLACLSLVIMWVNVPESVRGFYYTGCFIIEMAGLSISRIQFRYAAYTTIIIPVLSFFVMAVEGTLFLSQVITYGYFFGSVAVICLSSTYFMERSARRDFLQKMLLSWEQKNLRDTNEHLKELVDFDGLTHIANRRHFDHCLIEEWKRADRGQYPISLLMVDIDYFKKYNDHYGHQKGDDCLKQVAQILAAIGKRPGDLVARYGGEEFSIILPGSNVRNGEQVAMQIVKAVRAAKIENKGSTVSPYLTVSVGGGSCIPGSDVTGSDLLKVADEQLYLAKDQGRDRISWSELNEQKISQKS